jgi:ubiquitin carboxyl-terminal hydrolase 22/27/51
MNTSIQYYKIILQNIFNAAPVVPQTTRSVEGSSITSLTSNYLCLQCHTILTEEDRLKHGAKKSHRFCTWMSDGLPSLHQCADSRQMLTRGAGRCTARCAMTLCGIPHWRI